MTNLIRKAALPLALSLAMLAGTAMAQSTAPASATQSSDASSATGKSHESHAQRRMDEVQQQITDLHDELNITAAQSSQWDAYAQVMRDNAQRTGQALHERHQKMDSMSAEDSMKSYAELAQLNADNMQKLSSAFSSLYATLSTEQKQTADELFRNRPPRTGGMHHGKGGKPASASSSASSSGT